MNIIKDIAGEQAPFLLKLFARTLFGKALETFTILRGHGRNGKSLISELIYKTLGQYAYRTSSDLVTKINPKGGGIGPCPEIAQMHNNRLIITSKPSSQWKFKPDYIKNVTEKTEITGRNPHSSKLNVKILASVFVDLNNKLPFQGEIDDAIVERLIDYEFLNSYTNDKEQLGKPTSNGGVYKQANHFIQLIFFRELYRGSMMHILLDTFAKEFTNVNDINKV